MNIIISFAGLKPVPPSVPYPLRELAGGTILGHILVHLLDLPLDHLILILDSGHELVRDWIRTNLAELDRQVLLVEAADDPFAVLRSNGISFEANPLLFVAGYYIAEVNYLDLASPSMGAALLIQPEHEPVPGPQLQVDENGLAKSTANNTRLWAGSLWISDASQLGKALGALHEQADFSLAPLLDQLNDQGVEIWTKEAVYCLDTRTRETTLYANARLLSLDLGTQDAIERSYAEDFTVLPPVFLHNSAVIENSVIGPFVNLEAHTSVRNSIIRNSLIGTGTAISGAILSDSLVGKDVQITGHSSSIIADDGEIIEFSQHDQKS